MKTIVPAVMGLLSSQSGHAQSYYTLASGMEPSGLSANGAVAAVYSSSTRLFYTWTAAGGTTPIGGKWVSGAADISSDGMFVSGAMMNATGKNEAARYSSATGTWTPLGGLGSVSDGEVSTSWGISGDGQSVVGSGWITAGMTHALQWTASAGVKDLGSAVAGMSSAAIATDSSGAVVAGWQNSASNARQAAFWKSGIETVMVDGTGQILAQAEGVSADGQWIVGNGLSYTNLTWRYNTATHATEYLGDLDPTLDQNGVVGVSSDGSVIVGYDRDSFGFVATGRGTIWIAGQGMMDLTSYATSHGVTLPAGVTLSLPLAISADGTTISGINSKGAGFVVSIPSAVPEPGSLAFPW